jgi:hypothetical protein
MPWISCQPIFHYTNNQHAKNEKMWASRGQIFIAKMVDVFGEVVEQKFKFIQFVVIFQHLKLDRLLTNFKSMK